jgi:hypothetical protein
VVGKVVGDIALGGYSQLIGRVSHTSTTRKTGEGGSKLAHDNFVQRARY